MPTPSTKSAWWPSPAPCPGAGAAGGGTGTLAPLPGPVGQRRWTRSAQPPGKFMSILAREGQEASRQASGFRHAFVKEMKKENVDIVKWAFTIRKHASQREKKKSPKQVCPQTSLAVALFLPFSALLSSVTGSSTVGISFLSVFFVALSAL